MFALLIGINEYPQAPHFQKLNGCIVDINALQEWLTSAYPSTRFKRLENKGARRQDIIDAFEAIPNDDEIEEGDPIIIYFSGHGTSAEVPQEWKTPEFEALSVDIRGPRIELICPHDMGDVQGIPDRTLSVLIRRIAAVKGNNITVILDCCHSGSGTRNDVIRRPLWETTISGNLDESIWNSQAIHRTMQVAIPPTFRHALSKSHILLAACKENQVARDTVNGGVFTIALIRALRVLNVPIHRATYHQLHLLIIDKMPPLHPPQNPQCEGDNIRRYLFSLDSLERGVFRAFRDGDEIIVEAGRVQGVRPGTIFSLHHAGFSPGSVPPVETFFTVPVGELRATESTLQTTDSDLPQEFYVRIKQHGSSESTQHFRFYINSTPLTGQLLAPFARTTTDSFGDPSPTPSFTPSEYVDSTEGFKFVRVGDPDEAHLVIIHTPSSSAATLKLPCGVEPAQIQFSCHEPDQLARQLSRVAHFDFHLRRDEQDCPLRDWVTVELVCVLQKEKKVLQWENVIQAGEALCHDGWKYALIIKNKSRINLYPYVYYFGPRRLSIQVAYVPIPSSPSLPASGTLQIGSSTNCYELFEFEPLEDGTPDTGFIKIFFADRFVEMLPLGDIPDTAEDPNRHLGERSYRPPSRRGVDTWFSHLITVIGIASPDDDGEE